MSSKELIKLSIIACVLMLYQGSAYAEIKAPEAPPELPDTLKDFRTTEQLHELDEVKNSDGKGSDVEILEVQSAPFVPGDDSAGVVRFANTYVPGLVAGVPDRGALIMRFFDVDGVPWDIDSVVCEHPGFIAEVTASPSELLVRQGAGAAITTMKVTLRSGREPLIFTLRPVRLERGGVSVTAMIETIKLKQSQSGDHYQKPEPMEFSVPNPKASTVKFSDLDLDSVENTLVDAVRELKK